MTLQSELKKTFESIYGKADSSKKAYQDLLKDIKDFKEKRAKDLIQIDLNHADWYFEPDLIGMTLYVDLFAGKIKDLTQKIDYFKELGVNMIHLMPLLKTRDGENDGGYAVMDYQAIDENLGTMSDFKSTLATLRDHGIYVCIDYVINHVAEEHHWARKALDGDSFYQDFFIMFDTDDMPNQYNQTVPEVLPDKCPGNFTYVEKIKKYVFTSFSSFQWDLNFQNPHVFRGMVENMLFLSNLGVNMIRLDAIPFMWKKVGTTCRNLEPIHDLMYMLQLIKEMVCPSVALLGEAIVEPHEIIKYFGSEDKVECEIMYNANLMVDIFNSFATRDVRLLQIDTNHYHIPKTGSWMNYVRCHDDIGWGFNETAIAHMGFDPFMHKQFLIEFYGNKFPNTFSKGEYYQYNLQTKDARTNGTLASLLGLEKALESHDYFKIDTAIRRINLAHALIMFYRGFPLIYSGDEIATINDKSYLSDPKKAKEGRWIHRPYFDWKRAEKRHICGTPEYYVYQSLKHMIQVRKKHACFDGRTNQFALDTMNQAVLCLVKQNQSNFYFGLFNFSEHPQYIDLSLLRQSMSAFNYKDMIHGKIIHLEDHQIELSPYEYIWAEPVSS
ncbi:MAG: alpha-amylase [Tenericutes bacterium HGW-Tenericutes-6]|nr:MAG: alpha-amylase [Tenericutes bacterium HGW-Tenericutes-6]